MPTIIGVKVFTRATEEHIYSLGRSYDIDDQDILRVLDYDGGLIAAHSAGTYVKRKISTGLCGTTMWAAASFVYGDSPTKPAGLTANYSHFTTDWPERVVSRRLDDFTSDDIKAAQQAVAYAQRELVEAQRDLSAARKAARDYLDGQADT